MVQYRIRLNFKDGTQAYSHMVRLEIAITEDRLLQIWPNPIHRGDEVRFSYQMKDAGALDVLVSTLDGKMVLQKSEELNSGRNRLDFSTQGLAAGVYLLKVSSAHGSSVARFTIE